MKKQGLTMADQVQLKNLLAQEEPPSVKKLADHFKTTEKIIKRFMPKKKKKIVKKED